MKNNLFLFLSTVLIGIELFCPGMGFAEGGSNSLGEYEFSPGIGVGVNIPQDKNFKNGSASSLFIDFRQLREDLVSLRLAYIQSTASYTSTYDAPDNEFLMENIMFSFLWKPVLPIIKGRLGWSFSNLEMFGLLGVSLLKSQLENETYLYHEKSTGMVPSLGGGMMVKSVNTLFKWHLGIEYLFTHYETEFREEKIYLGTNLIFFTLGVSF